MEEEPNLRATQFDLDAFEEHFNNVQNSKDVPQGLQRLCGMLDAFQEEPYLLDPYLSSIFPAITTHLRAALDSPAPKPQQQVDAYTQLAYTVLKVRGHKTIVKLFPHAPSDLNVLLHWLDDDSDPANIQNSWMLRYILLLWLSLVVRLPFDLKLWDQSGGPSSSTSASHSSTPERILNLSMRYTSNPGKDRDAASVLIGALCSRTGRNDACLSQIIDTTLSQLSTSTSGPSAVVLLEALNEVLQHAEPSMISDHMTSLGTVCQSAVVQDGEDFDFKYGKASVKLLGRLALASFGDSPAVIPPLVESTLGALVSGLSHKETAVRYSCAKYLARLSQKLPPDMATEVLLAVQDVFDSQADQNDIGISDNAWHGGCLAVAELTRHQLVPGSFLKTFVPHVLRALSFDVRRGSQAVGTAVRDAACYVLWTMARSFKTADLEPFSVQLQTHIVNASLFDREVQIRRASSSAFQEIVGRHNLFHHGISVLQLMNMFTVGLRRKAYLDVAVSIASYCEYRRPILDHLENSSLRHWDVEVRTLAADALRSIYQGFEADLVSCLERLRPRALSSDDISKHGVLVALARISSLADQEQQSRTLQILAELQAPPPKGTFAVLLAIAGCDLAASCAHAGNVYQHMTSCCAFIDAAIAKNTETCNESALAAVQAMSKALSEQRPLVRRYLSKLNGFSPSAQEGAALCLGGFCFPEQERVGLKKVFGDLLKVFGPSAAKSVAVRRNAFRSLRLLALNHELSPEESEKLLQATEQALCDYTTDTRGDVGLWLRVEGCRALPDITKRTQASSSISQSLSCLVLKLCLDKIDTVRDAAITALGQLGMQEQYQAVASLLFLKREDQARSIEVVFPAALPLFAEPQLRLRLFEGVCMQLGVPPEAQNGRLRTSFESFWASIPSTGASSATLSKQALLECLIESMKDKLRDNRQFTAFAYMALFLSDMDQLENLSSLSQCYTNMLDTSARLVMKSKNTSRIQAAASLCISLGVGGLPRAAEQLRCYLVHPQATVRQWTAETLNSKLEHKIATEEVNWSDDEQAETMLHSFQTALQR